MSKLGFGVVGCGEIAGPVAWLSRLVRQVRLTACCDVDPDRAQAFARRHRIGQLYGDLGEMLASPAVEAVYLAVPHHLHAPMVLAAVEAGKPALVEKPLARTLDEGVRLVEAAGDFKIGVNYQYRYDRGCHALARAVQSGALGRVASVRINVPWHRAETYFEGAPWHGTIAQAGGGTLITQGSHFLDLALWALGERPASAMGYAASPGFGVEVETLVHGVIETDGEALISITSSMVAATEEAVSVEFYGDRGTAIYSDRPWPRVRFVGVRVRKARPPVWGVHALQRSLAAFAEWVLGGEPYLAPAREALPALAAVEAIYRSARSGRREAVDRLAG
jgi:UDP-N-acetyl-2-amino-2-deoxyglucuronate dehydrogenase